MCNLFKYLKTIRRHRKYVRQACFKMGIPLQGLTHDLSKYSLREIRIAKYYSGLQSPHIACREENGYSSPWLNHYHVNKHHWEFWLDIEDWPDNIIAAKMPYNYVIEMFCDFIGAGKAYSTEKWSVCTPWEYYTKACAGKRLMHPESEYLLRKLLWNLKEMNTEKEFYSWYKRIKKYLKTAYDNNALKNYDMIGLC